MTGYRDVQQILVHLPVIYLTNKIGFQDCGMCYKNTQMEIWKVPRSCK